MIVGEAVGEVERGPAGLVDEGLEAVAVFPERGGGADGGRVDDAPHGLGPLALLQDDAVRVHDCFGWVLVLHKQSIKLYWLDHFKTVSW